MQSTERAWRQAQQAFAERRWDDARQLLEKVLALEPKAPGVLVLLSYVHSYLGHYRAAREKTLLAAALPPDSAETAVDVAARLRTFNAGKQMVEYVDRLGSPSRLPIPMLLQCAAQYSYLNLQAKAHRYLSEALAADPEYPPTQVAMAQVLIYLGRGQEAQQLLRKTLARAPQIPEVYGLAGQLGQQIEDPEPYITAGERLLADAGPAGMQRAKLAFALHHLHDARRNYERAYSLLQEGCRLKRAALEYSSEDSRRMFELLKCVPAKSATQRREARDAMPIFIIGMHRSGTSLLEQLLSTHRAILGIGELYDFTGAMRAATDYHCRGVMDAVLVQKAISLPLSYSRIGKAYLESTSWRLHGEPAFSDKLPSNFLNVGFIAQSLPQAKILHMVRDPMETCFSNLRELFSDANPYSYDQAELAEYFTMYRDLMRHWHACFPGRILDVDYARLTTDTEAVMREVASFCGVDTRLK